MSDDSWCNYSQSKIFPPEQIHLQIAQLRKEKKTIATLNGAFDLLHAGHMYMIFEAAKTADALIIAVNSDISIHRYKSPKRPIIPLRYRLEMLSALHFIDCLTWFDENDPCAILEKIKPDVHVNGSEYGENCVEAETVKKYGGRIHLIDRIPGLATSEILKKIQGLNQCG